jgi:predicted RNA methylase
MAPGDQEGSAPPPAGSPQELSHWVKWHGAYEDPASSLSLRLRTVQAMVRQALDAVSSDLAGPIRIVSLCAGQGRDVIDVVAGHPRRDDVSALLVELDPALVAFARARADASGVGRQVRIVEGDASLARWYTEQVPADLVLVCGVFGNISAADITAMVHALPSFCLPGARVIWTRHRLPPDATPSIRADFAAAGFSEVAFEAPEGTVMTVGHHRFDGATPPFDPARRLFDFVGDGLLPR